MIFDASHTFRVFDNRNGDELFLGKWAPKAKHSAATIEGGRRMVVQPYLPMPKFIPRDAPAPIADLPPKFVFDVIMGPSSVPPSEREPALFVTCDEGRKLVLKDIAERHPLMHKSAPK